MTAGEQAFARGVRNLPRFRSTAQVSVETGLNHHRILYLERTHMTRHPTKIGGIYLWSDAEVNDLMRAHHENPGRGDD